MKATPLPDDEYCTNRSKRTFKTKNGRVQEYVFETLVTKHFPNGLRRVHGGGVQYSKSYLFSADGADCEAKFAEWIAKQPMTEVQAYAIPSPQNQK